MIVTSLLFAVLGFMSGGTNEPKSLFWSEGFERLFNPTRLHGQPLSDSDAGALHVAPEPSQRNKKTSTQSAKAPPPDRWQRLRSLVGTWEGESQGEPGKGRIRLEVSFVLNERYLRITGTSDYQPRKPGEKGEHHEDFGYVSFDKARSKFVFRQFHTEGFVNQYVMTGDPAGEIMEFTSEALENAPPGWRAKETYSIEDGELKHSFFLARKDNPFEVYASSTLKRVKP
jgi:hypothetical protein